MSTYNETEPALAIQRYLDNLEVRMLGQYPIQAVAYCGSLNESALDQAFHLLCKRHAVLRGRIRQDAHGYLLEASASRYPRPMIAYGDDSTLQNEISKPLDSTNAVAYLIVIRGESQGYVSLRVDHAVVDGTAYFTLWNELWRLYTDIFEGEDVSVRLGSSLPHTNVELYARWADIQPATSGLPTDERDVKDLCEIVFRRLRLSRAATTQLVEAAREHGTTVGALMSGTFAIALRRHGCESPNQNGAMRLLSTVDLRRHISPAVTATQATNFMGLHVATLTVPISGDPLTIARDYGAQLAAGIANRQLHLYGFSTKRASSAESLRMNEIDLWVNNGGRVQGFPHPDSMEITDFFRVWSSSNRELRRPSDQPPRHSVVTYDGRMTIDCSYPAASYPPNKVDEIMHEVNRQFQRITRSEMDVKILSEEDLERI